MPAATVRQNAVMPVIAYNAKAEASVECSLASGSLVGYSYGVMLTGHHFLRVEFEVVMQDFGLENERSERLLAQFQTSTAKCLESEEGQKMTHPSEGSDPRAARTRSDIRDAFVNLLFQPALRASPGC